MRGSSLLSLSESTLDIESGFGIMGRRDMKERNEFSKKVTFLLTMIVLVGGSQSL
jgi:hypothetical protein